MAKQKLYDANGNEVNAKIKKPFYKKWWVWLLAVIVVVAVAGGGNDDSTTKTESSNTNAKKEEQQAYGIGQEVVVGDVAYIVNSVEERSEITRPYTDSITTSGKFLVVNVTVKNNGKEAKVIDSGMFKVFNSSGSEFSSNVEADMYINEGNIGFFLQKINPQMDMTGNVSFEVPADATGLQLQVSNSMLGGKTAKINLQ